jgi:hypothetical protein
MAEGDKKGSTNDRISEKQRFSYIGFEVFPGKPKDLFKNDAEKQKLVGNVLNKRELDETIRDDCKLMEERVSFGERIILAVASVAILAALALPWYSAYVEVDVEAEPMAEAVVDSAALALTAADSLAMTDTLAGETVVAEVVDETSVESDELVVEETIVMAEAEPEAEQAVSGIITHQGERANEQIITAHSTRVSIEKEYTYLSGFGTFAALGSVGGPVFSSGIILVLTGILMLAYGLLCVALPVLNLYGIFGLKGNPDDIALKLKKYLKFNWLPLILFVAAMLLSFFGADYGFDTTDSYTSLGGAYGVEVFLGSLSWGMFVALAASLLVAVKGIEI